MLYRVFALIVLAVIILGAFDVPLWCRALAGLLAYSIAAHEGSIPLKRRGKINGSGAG